MPPILQAPSDRLIVLASTSLRRREILLLLGIPFLVVAPNFEEVFTPAYPVEKEVVSFAQGKARSVMGQFKDAIIIGGDTLIECDGEKIGKPKDVEDARRILHWMQGKPHRILTAVTLIDTTDQTEQTDVSCVQVWFRKISRLEIERYVTTNETRDKAGGYSLRGESRSFVRHMEGDVLSAVGLPTEPIVRFLKTRTTFTCQDIGDINERLAV